MYNSMYYNNFYPYQAMRLGAGASAGSRLLRGGILNGIGKVNWGSLLTNTQKTLNVINQAIPVYYQVKPFYNNAKTMFRVMGALKDDKSSVNRANVSDNSNVNSSVNSTIKNTNQNRPVFFT